MSTLDLGARSSFTTRCYRSSWSDKPSLEARQRERQDTLVRDFTVFSSFAKQARVLASTTIILLSLIGCIWWDLIAQAACSRGIQQHETIGHLRYHMCFRMFVYPVKVDRSVESLLHYLKLSRCVCAFRLTRSSQVDSKLCEKHYPMIGMPVTPTTTSTIYIGRLWQY